MSKVFFDDLGLPNPDFNFEVGSGSHATQTAAIMVAFERLLLERPCDLVIVVGDVNSTAACGLVTSKLGTPLAHVEAGLRSFECSMPEEINRVDYQSAVRPPVRDRTEWDRKSAAGRHPARPSLFRR
jgi:UDP-N-acetylglucosamine 2-epimerase (non-hydrolysing)